MNVKTKSHNHLNISRKGLLQNPKCSSDKRPRKTWTGGNILQCSKGYIWQSHSQHHTKCKET